MLKIRWIFSIPLVLLAVAVQANDGAAQTLAGLLAPYKSSCGEFEQRQFSAKDELLEKSGGRFCVLRPFNFLWEITEPSGQKILLNETYLWHYDEDLETATRYSASTEGQIAPLQLLGGKAEELADSFTISRSMNGDNFILTPIENQDAFASITLSFTDDKLTNMNVTDNIGQRLDIAFRNIEHKPTLSEADFSFSPPDMADVFYRD